MAIKNGIILYTIERDGCLNGVYTHEGLKGKIFNEIARKLRKQGNKTTYACAYFEAVGQDVAKTAILEITREPSGILRFSWLSGGKEIFHGDGYKMNPLQMSVIYHAGKRPK